MKTSFTLTELHAHRGCYSKEMINYCARGLGIINLDFIIEHDEMKLTEKAWFISNHIGMTPHEHAAFALGCATIAVDMYEASYPSVLDVRKALDNDTSIPYAMQVAAKHNRQAAYAIYSACTRDPYDRIHSAANAIELSGNDSLMLDYFRTFCR